MAALAKLFDEDEGGVIQLCETNFKDKGAKARCSVIPNPVT